MSSASLACAALPAAGVDTVLARPTGSGEMPEWVPLINSGWGMEHDQPHPWALIDWHGAPHLVHLLPEGRIQVHTTASGMTIRQANGYTWLHWDAPHAHGCPEPTPPTPTRINHMWDQYQPPAEEGQLSLIPLGQLQ